MSKGLRTIGIVAGVIALTATGVGALGSAGLIGATAGSAAAAAGAATGAAIAATATSIATYASIAATVASIGAQALAKPPRAQGVLNRRTIGSNQPQPYLIGESYYAGAQIHDVGFGPEVNDTPNPYRFIAAEISGAGPIDGLVATLIDYQAVTFSGTAATGYYAGFLYRDFRLGTCPDTALTPNWSGAGGWSASHKLSGHAAIGWTLKFDKKGKKFASGVPVLGAIWRGVKVYDPRLDSTYPGGSGSHRIDNEATWTYSRNPALHALAYAYGRHQNGKFVLGADLGATAISLPHVVAWANVCEANGWTVNGVVYEPGDTWNNLKQISEAGSAAPDFAGGVLIWKYDAPKALLDTISTDDLAGEVSVIGWQSWKSRINTIIPRYRSTTHQWEYVAASAVADSAAVTADGEEKSEEQQWDLVTDPAQVATLAGYRIGNGREAGPIVLPCKLRMIEYGAGSRLQLSAGLTARLGLSQSNVAVVNRTIDVAAGIVELTVIGDSDAKHTFALGRTVTTPPLVDRPGVGDQDEISGDVRPEDGISPISVSALPEGLQINLNADGSPIPGALPQPIGFSATQAGAVVAITDVALVSSSGVTASDGGLQINVTGVAGGTDGEVVIDVTAAGQTVRKRIPVSMRSAGSNGALQQVLAITTPQLTWTSYAVHGGSIAINASAAGKLRLNLTGNMRVAIGGDDLRFQSKLQYRDAGGTWTDVSGSEAISTKSETVSDPTRVLAANVNGAGPYTLTVLTVNGPYEVRALTRKYDGTATTTATVALSMSAEQVA